MIQRHWRAHCEMLQQRSHYLLIKQAVLVIQCKFRIYRSTRRHRAAQTIQAHIRGYLQLCRYERLKYAACVIQLAYRKHLAILQAEEKRRQFSAMTIQSCWRRYIYQRNYLTLRHACIVIQQHYRAKVLGDKTRSVFKAKRTAAITIQSALRRLRAHNVYLAQRNASVVIQRWYRSTILSIEGSEQTIRKLFRLFVLFNIV